MIDSWARTASLFIRHRRRECPTVEKVRNSFSNIDSHVQRTKQPHAFTPLDFDRFFCP